MAYDRWQDFANTLIAPDRRQILDDRWLARMNVARHDVGTGMTGDECAIFNKTVNVDGVRAYWEAVGDAVQEVARSVPSSDLGTPVETRQPQDMLHDGTIGNERARWLPSFWKGRARVGFWQWRCGTRPNICWVESFVSGESQESLSGSEPRLK
jgi:hypothetical protein